MPKTILIVDDSQSIRSMTEFSLKQGGYTVVTANDGQQAIETFKAVQCDAVITDHNMPKMTGLQLVAEIRKLPNGKTVPILLLTTESSEDMKNRGRAAGATGWLVKPFEPTKLLDVVAKVTSKK